PTFANSTPVTYVNGWIVIQQRIDGSQSFNRTWSTYKAGFGTYDANFWLGLEKIFQLTNSHNYKLRFEVLVIDGSWISDEYETFKIDSEGSQYALHVSDYSGDNLDILNQQIFNGGHCHNGMRFSTYDQNYTPRGTQCPTEFSSGNWFNANCYAQNVFGIIFDVTVRGYYTAKYQTWTRIKACRMMIKLY
ncbi:hypothetical protein HELRODRAFT_81424, partial [Helobdella robusta]|uniref:Fibrinogen C-terminal domain-containing protein n=1 Tax=Helobdella robusta TaxID=6412 RepID=T1G4E2_HELRO